MSYTKKVPCYQVHRCFHKIQVTTLAVQGRQGLLWLSIKIHFTMELSMNDVKSFKLRSIFFYSRHSYFHVHFITTINSTWNKSKKIRFFINSHKPHKISQQTAFNKIINFIIHSIPSPSVRSSVEERLTPFKLKYSIDSNYFGINFRNYWEKVEVRIYIKVSRALIANFRIFRPPWLDKKGIKIIWILFNIYWEH